MDLDRDAAPHNNPGSRGGLVNAPGWADGLTLQTYPRQVPDGLATWTPARGVGLVLWGPVGAGKTGLAVCTLRVLAGAGYGSTFYWNMVSGPGVLAAVAAGDMRRQPAPCWFESWPRLLAAYRRERFDEEGWFANLEERVSALVLDDIGVDTATPFRESFLLRHLEWAADRRGRTLVLTVNSAPAEWRSALGERISDRLTDPSRFSIVHVGDETLR